MRMSTIADSARACILECKTTLFPENRHKNPYFRAAACRACTCTTHHMRARAPHSTPRRRFTKLSCFFQIEQGRTFNGLYGGLPFVIFENRLAEAVDRDLLINSYVPHVCKQALHVDLKSLSHLKILVVPQYLRSRNNALRNHMGVLILGTPEYTTLSTEIKPSAWLIMH